MLQNTLKQLKKKDRTRLLKQLSSDLPTGCNASTRNPAITSELLKRITYIRMNADKLNPTELNEALQMIGFPMIDSWNPTIIDEQRRLIFSYLNEKTVTGNPITLNIIGNFTPEVTGLKVTMNPIQDLSHGDPSPTNICPISGRDSVTLTRTVGEDVETHTHTYDSTVYGGVDDFVSGNLTVEKGYLTISDIDTWSKIDVTQGTLFRGTIEGIKTTSSSHAVPDLISSAYKTTSQSDRTNLSISMPVNAERIDIIDNTYSSVSDFISNRGAVQICYKLATPTQITNTPEDISLLKGVNVFSTDGDSIELKYKLSLT